MNTRKILVAAIVLAILTLTACNSDRRQVEKVAYGYLIAAANYQIDDAMPYVTKVTREVTLPFFRDKMIPITDTAYIVANTPAEITITDVRFEGDSAWVDFTQETPSRIIEGSINVVKEDGKWLVDLPLELPETISVSPQNAISSISTSQPDSLSK